MEADREQPPEAKRSRTSKIRERVRRCIFPQSHKDGSSSHASDSPSRSKSQEPAMDIISYLPKELALNILTRLESTDLLNASQTCRTWRVLAEDDVLWRLKSKRISLPDERFLFPGSLSMDGFQRSLWKMNYIHHYRIDRNWRNDTNRAPVIIPAHKSHLITCLLLTDDNRAVTGSDDKTLRVWSVATGKCLFSLEGHNGGVWTAELEGNLLVSGSTDRTVRTWNLEDGCHMWTFFGHASTVRCLALKNGVCVSGSRDNSLRIWKVGLNSSDSITSNVCTGVLLGHEKPVKCVRYDGVFIVSGSYDFQVRVWNPVSNACLHVLSGHTERVYSLQFDGTHVVSGSLDSSIRVWDVQTGALKHVLTGHESLISGMHQRGNILVSGNADSTVRLWDIRSGVCLQTLGADGVKHQSGVVSMHFDENFVVTASDDGTVKLWDMASGKFVRDIVSLGSPDGVIWKIVANKTKLICAVGKRDRVVRDTAVDASKLLFFDFDTSLPTWGHPSPDSSLSDNSLPTWGHPSPDPSPDPSSFL
ncbi:F-box/WD repeat-containing protein 7 [Hypsibius exemplaris]|uniref:F-box/WD repeat-containing protein 7 n=1 Tax=Hypsibius exemplaris TaxID=2072580 RepID=A0A1W0X170_HYPEX|nr:F-box/WD repeat-containing protein 7 [Hypsibius exemplaris]